MCSHYRNKTGNTALHASTWRVLRQLSLPNADHSESGLVHPLQTAHVYTSWETHYQDSPSCSKAFNQDSCDLEMRRICRRAHEVLLSISDGQSVCKPPWNIEGICQSLPKCRLQHNHNSKCHKFSCTGFCNRANKPLVQHGILVAAHAGTVWS